MHFKKFFIPIIALFTLILILGAVLMLLSKPQTEPNIPASPAGGQYPISNIPQPAQEESADAVREQVVIKEFDDSFLENSAQPIAPSKDEADKAELQLFVRNFLEDFGSFSFNGGYGHIEDLYDKMTVEFRAYVDGWLAGDPAHQLSQEFYSIQTIVSEVKITEFASTKAKLIADAARIETKAPEYYGKRFIMKAEIDAVKIGGEWKMSSVYWK